jgi:polysaccharide deacetylase 2 family uncharacterized protein YibQ
MIIKKPALPKGKEPWPAFYLVTAAMVATAIISAVALDYINQRKGERSYFFPKREPKPAVVAEANPPSEETENPEAAPSVAEPKREPTPAVKEKEAPAKEPEPPAKARRRGRAQVALIVDDMGNSREALDVIIGLKAPVTVSVLPYSSYAAETALSARKSGLEVLLHLPLESLNNHDSAYSTDGLILASMSPEQIVAAFEVSLACVPYADGVNNHMGSKFTADAALMRALLAPIKDRGLLFIDSRTTADTVAYGEARKMGIPAAERDLFLDADVDRGRIPGRLVELFKLAKSRGRAIGICHPYPETLEALRTGFRQFADFGLEVVPVSRLVQK